MYQLRKDAQSLNAEVSLSSDEGDNCFTEYLVRNRGLLMEVFGISYEEIVKDSARIWKAFTPGYKEYMGKLCSSDQKCKVEDTTN